MIATAEERIQGNQARFTVAELVYIAEWVECEATPESRGSRVHGPRHWCQVARLGVEIAKASGGDPVLAFLFGSAHDAERHNDGSDPAHGARACHLLDSMGLNDDDRNDLAFAMIMHDTGDTSTDPVVGSCWDADRLTLYRVGTKLDAEYLSTAYARANMRLGWDTRRDDISWVEIAEMALA